MASIAKTSNGHRAIQFVDNDPARTRRTIRLGKCPRETALEYKIKIEALHSAKMHNVGPKPEVIRWLAERDDTLHARIAAVGLCEPRGSITIAGFIAAFLERRTDLKPRTISNLSQSRRHLLAFIDGKRAMRSITPANAEDFRLYLTRPKPDPVQLALGNALPGAGLGENTARRILGRSRQLWRAAIKRGAATVNPFDGIACAVQPNRERFHFVTREDAAKVNDACPDATWRLIFALARFGGLRTPSETLALKWADVDFENNRIRVPSPKTEHHAGRASRLIPMFPELRKPLLDAFDAATEGGEWVIEHPRSSGVNLRTRFERIILRAGLKPWPKLFQNLRATRATELADVFPSHVCCEWLGHTETIADANYRRTTEQHFAAASGEAGSALQNALQSEGETGRNDPQQQNADSEQTPISSDVCEQSEPVAATCETHPIPRRGLEPLLPA